VESRRSPTVSLERCETRLADELVDHLSRALDESRLHDHLIESRCVGALQPHRVGVVREPEDRRLRPCVRHLVGIDASDVADHEIGWIGAVGRDEPVPVERPLELRPEHEVDPDEQDRRHVLGCTTAGTRREHSMGLALWYQRPRMSGKRTAATEPNAAARQRDVVRGARTALVLLVVLLVASFVGAALVAKRLNESARDEYVRDAIPLATLVQDLVIQMLNQETSVRGYVITERRSLLKPYDVGRRGTARDLVAMREYLPSHPGLAELVTEARPKIAALQEFNEAQIALVGQGGEALELARSRTLRGKALFDEFRGVAERMLVDTEAFVANAQRRNDADYRRLVGYLAGLGTLALAIGGALIVVVPRRLSSAYASERLARARVDRLRAVQFELTGSLEEDEVRAIVTRQAVQLFGAEGAAVVQVPETRAMVVLAASSLSADVRRGIDTTDGALGEQVRGVVLRAHAKTARGEPDQIDGPHGQTIVLTRLGGGEGAAESLALVYRDARSVDAELGTVATFGRQACQALENARLYARERHIAETLQRSAMPRSLPSFESLRIAARYLPGSTEADIGGDWFDVFTRPDGQICAVVGDVGGKGVDAASQMGQLRSALRAFALDAASPADVLRSLGRYRTDDDELFATVAVVLIDATANRASIALAGHPPPLLRHADGSATFLEGGRGAPLGVGIELPVENAELILGEGDLLLLYTDGLVEKRKQQLGEGLDRLQLVATTAPADPDAFLDHILASLVPEERRADDIAVLALGPAAQPTVTGEEERELIVAHV